MKKFVTLILAGALAASMAVAANAAEMNALKGTPTVDGKLDDIYKQGTSIVTKAGESKIWAGGTGEESSDAEATTYALWDDKYIYFATEVTESTVVDTGIASGWRADAVEHWIKYEDILDKVTVDAFGTKIYGNSVIIPQADCKFATTRSDDGYVIELAVPISIYKAGDSIDLSIQLNDFLDVEGANGASWGSQQADSKLVLSADEVVLPKAEEPKTEEPTQSAETADPTALAVLAAVAAAAGVVVSKKKH